jgi:Uma2 family endonuclease
MSTVPNVGVAGGFVPVLQPDGAMSPIDLLRRFSVEEFYRLGELGIIRPEERVELLEGIITMVPPIGEPHATSCDLIYRTFLKILPPGLDVSNGREVKFVDSVPIPDGLVLRGSVRDFAVKKAHANDIALVVEVADSPLVKDRGLMQRIYATSGIPEYWIVNLPERKLEVYRRPAPATGEQSAKYENIEVFSPEQSIDVVVDGTKVGSITVSEILP